MSTPKPRLWAPAPHRAVDWNEKAVAKRLLKGPLVAGVKLDGFRCLILKLDGKLVCTTREGIEMTSLRPFYNDLDAILWNPSVISGITADICVYDCEVIIHDLAFEDMSGHFRREEPIAEELRKDVQFCLLDYGPSYHYAKEGTFDRAFEDRRTDLNCLQLPTLDYTARSEALVVTEGLARVRSVMDIKHLYERVRTGGKEGLVVKDPDMIARTGKVTGWWKVKPGCGAEWAPGFEADGKVVGYVWGDEKKANFGKIVGFAVELESGRIVNATGLSQDAMQRYTAQFLSDGGFALGRCCRVTAMEETKDGSLRHPHFDGFRDIDGAEGVKA
jgi:ATP-dependent DNA ligase